MQFEMKFFVDYNTGKIVKIIMNNESQSRKMYIVNIRKTVKILFYSIMTIFL